MIGLLSQIGGDTAGALSIGQTGRTATVQWRSIESPADLEGLIEGLPSKPFLAGEEGVSMSLAGAQTKLAVAVDEAGRISVPMNGSPSTHILKPDDASTSGNICNEAFTQTLARSASIFQHATSPQVAPAKEHIYSWSDMIEGHHSGR